MEKHEYAIVDIQRVMKELNHVEWWNGGAEIGENAAALCLCSWDGLGPVFDGGQVWVPFIVLYPYHGRWWKGVLVMIGWPGIEVPGP